MSESLSSREIIERLVKQSGMKRKLAAGILRALPEIIEEGLKKDGEVRVKGLGTFRLRWVKERVGRNPKTGERVQIPPHNRMVFLPETSFKEYINRDLQLLTYEVIDEQVETVPENGVTPEVVPEPVHEHVQVPGIQSEAKPEARKPKRRIHWIVPVAILVIIILSVIFYFRNFYQAGDSSQETVDSGQLAVDSSQLAVDSSQLVVGSSQLADSTQNSELSIPNSELNTQHSELLIVPEGKRLYQLARETYGDPFLWVLIYRANQDKISDPDILITGTELVIPALEGTAVKLTRNDSAALTEGYRMVYDFYMAKGDPMADDFLKGVERYKPE